MKKFIVYPLLGILLSIVVFPSFAQQNQNTSQQEIEALKKQISEIQSKLQTVENVEKMELAAKLAEAEARLINTEFGKLKLELKDSNQQWLRNWIFIILGILSVVGFTLWKRLTEKMDDLIEDRIEDSLNGFKKAVEQVKILEKEQAVTMLQDYAPGLLTTLEKHTERIKTIKNEVLLNIFSDKTRDLQIKWVAADVLVAREIPQFVSPVLKFLNSVIDSDIDLVRNFNFSYDPRFHLSGLVYFVGKIHTQEAYNGLKNLLNRLLTENPVHKDLLIAWTAYSLALVSVALNQRDSIPILIKSIPDWDFRSQENENFEELANCFNSLKAPEGIKEIMTHHADTLPELKEKCLELLEKYNSNNTQGENTIEPKQPK